MTILRPFFKGETLESEFGFVNYYHSHSINRLLHTLAIPLLLFGIVTITTSISSQLPVIFAIFYCFIVCLFDYKTAVAYAVLFMTIMIISVQIVPPVSYGVMAFMLGLIMQGLGHFVFQGYSPAFRLFEAIFTTPVFLMMNLISDHHGLFWKNVENETMNWKKILRQ